MTITVENEDGELRQEINQSNESMSDGSDESALSKAISENIDLLNAGGTQ